MGHLDAQFSPAIVLVGSGSVGQTLSQFSAQEFRLCLAYLGHVVDCLELLGLRVNPLKTVRSAPQRSKWMAQLVTRGKWCVLAASTTEWHDVHQSC